MDSVAGGDARSIASAHTDSNVAYYKDMVNPEDVNDDWDAALEVALAVHGAMGDHPSSQMGGSAESLAARIDSGCFLSNRPFSNPRLGATLELHEVEPLS